MPPATMADDGYRSPRNSSPYRDTLDSRHVSNKASGTFLSDTDKQMPSRSRTSSGATFNGTNSSRDAPLHDAINTATNTAVKGTDSANQVDQDLVAQITEQVTKNVINAMKASGMNTSPPASEASYTGSQYTSTNFPLRYTPPSPSGRYETVSHRSSSPEPPISEAGSFTSDTPRATSRRDSNPSPHRSDTTARPRPPRVPSAIQETTPLETAWQPLFDKGVPTARLGQFLRGIAMHLIKDYEPKGSLVVTPAKMVQFFTETKQPDEIYPFGDIFGGRCMNISISKMYQNLRCQHHLVQRGWDDHNDPTIPGLTPHGFQSWMTLLIQAHPDKEFDRLAQAVLNMPISNADLPTERFPKQLSRRLLPAEDDRLSQQKLYHAISADRNIQLRNSNPMPPPPSQPPPSQPAPINTSFMERERNPYSSTPNGSTFPTTGTIYDEEMSQSPRIPIERERQPYTAREGTGKIFEERERELREQGGATTGTRGSRSDSTAPAPPSAYASNTRPMDVPPPNNQRNHRSSMSGGARPNLSYGTTPPTAFGTKNPNTKSEGANIGDIPKEYYASNLGLHSDRDRDTFDEDGARRYPRRAAGDDENRYIPSQLPSLRTQTSSGGQSGYDYNGRDPREYRDSRDTYDDSRRRSAYNGGTDGYGSHSRGC